MFVYQVERYCNDVKLNKFYKLQKDCLMFGTNHDIPDSIIRPTRRIEMSRTELQ